MFYIIEKQSLFTTELLYLLNNLSTGLTRDDGWEVQSVGGSSSETIRVETEEEIVETYEGAD